MTTLLRSALIACLAAQAVACASVTRLDAAGDVHALLIAIRDNDQASFEQHIDRAALTREIEARMVAEAKKDQRLGGLAAIFAPALAQIAGDALVQPEVFKAVAERYGYTPKTRIPGPVVISQALKSLPDGRICATREKDGPCLLVFTRGADGHWRLSGFEGDLSMLRLDG